jgi:alpha-N-arabinofuranosidase
VNVNPGGMQWSSDLIGYNASTSYGSPSYYAQVMFASCLGDHTVNSSIAGAADKFFYSATVSTKSGKACLKLVNAASTPQPLNITLTGLSGASHSGRVETLKANTTWATNTITDPKQIAPSKSEVNINGGRLAYVLPAYSIQVLELDLK